MEKCKKCSSELMSWSEFKEMEMRDNTLVAILGSVVNGAGHIFWGNSRYKGAEFWTQEVYFCYNCKTYYMRCTNCKNLIPLGAMPENGQTLKTCDKCGKQILYAHDYDMGGG